ncbi:MAG: NTP transferase domain-containing protein [Bifidobacteriaceae bacterium]|nr:NTP transferase domain-containing protein [Bifidobacteriaceae bacterium]
MDNVIILAAGEGTRMKSSTPKVLHKLCGKEIIQRVLETATELNPKTIVVVLKHEMQKVQSFIEALNIPNIKFVEQSDIMGTGQAVKDALQVIDNKTYTYVIAGDTPLISGAVLKKMFEAHKDARAKATILTTQIQNPTGFGRIVRDGKKLKIVEQTDASKSELEIKEVNTSNYIFDIPTVLEFINNLDTNNSKREVYLTDIIEFISNESTVETVEAQNPAEVLGVNNRVQLAELSAYKYFENAKAHMLNGVTIVDPKATYIDDNVLIGQDATILPGCVISSDVQIGKGATVGPYSYLRPGTNLGDGGKIGAFVETKNAKIGKGSKVPHLSYVGDAQIGENTNIGAGSIFANYDGKNKHQTLVGSNCKIGSDTVIVAPKKIGNNVYTGAGTVVLEDIKDGEKVVSQNKNRKI